MKSLQVVVGEAFIAEARDRQGPKSTTCPIALAVAAANPGSQVFVGLATIRIEDFDGQRVFWLPLDAREFVNEFDSGRPVERIEFSAEQLL